MNKLEFFYNICLKTGVFKALKYWQNNRDILTILAYHRVYPLVKPFFFDPGLISATPDQFERQLQYLRKNHYNIIDFYELNDYLNEGNIPAKSIIITFDDGYEDNYTYAYPLLKKYNSKAVIFLTTDNINQNLPFWFDRVAFYFKSEFLDYMHMPEIFNYYWGKKEKDFTLENILETFKIIPNTKRLQVVAELDIKYKHKIYENNNIRFAKTLSWGQIKEMSKNQIEFGSHTCSHPILPKIEFSELIKKELFESKRNIENNIGKEVISFSYPNGDIWVGDDFQYLKEAGYKFAVDYEHGKNSMKHFNRFMLHRLHIESYISYAFFVGSLLL